MAEGIAVEELEGPFENGEQAADNAEDDVANGATNTTVVHGLLAGNGANLAQELNNGDKQAAEADGAEAVSESTLGRGAGGILGEVVDAEVPGAVDAGNDGVDCVFEPLADPVHSKRDKHHKTNHLGLATVLAVLTALWIIRRRFPFDVNSDERDGEPSSKGRADQTTNQANNEDMTVLFADVNAGPKHEGGEGDSRDPRVKRKRHECAKDEEDDAGRVVLLVEVKDGGTDGEDNVEDTRDPDEGLGERAREGDVEPGEDKGDTKADGEEDDGAAVERKGVAAVVDAAAGVSCGVALDGNGRDDDVARKDGEEEQTSPPVIVLWLVDLEGLVEAVLFIAALGRVVRVWRRRAVGWLVPSALLLLRRRLLVLLLAVLRLLLLTPLLLLTVLWLISVAGAVKVLICLTHRGL